MNLLDRDRLADESLKLCERRFVHFSGFGDKDVTGTHGFSGEAFGNVLFIDGLDSAAVFFVYAQLAAAHFQSRLEVQQIGPQRRDAGAAPAFPHELQRIEHEAGVHLVGEGGDMLRDLFGLHASVAAFGGFYDQ